MNSQNAKKASSLSEERAPRRVSDLLRAGAARLREADVDSPRLCAEMLMAHLLECDHVALHRRSGDEISTDDAARFGALLARRVTREPVQHIIGHTEFWSLDILCDPSALVPRPETEVLIETAFNVLKNIAAPVIADIGTGTGCIVIALAKELPRARLFASDISCDALALAARNLETHGLTQRVQLIEGDLAEPFLRQGLAGQFDAIVCNPPYIAESDKPTLQPEVRDYEPEIALYGGANGLRVIARLLAETGPLLKPAGYLIIEIAQGQAHAARELAQNPIGSWRVIRTISDPAGIERVLLIQKEEL